MARRKRTFVDDPAVIELLASPARIEIVDTLEAFGDFVPVSELAERLGRAADGLYYHLNQLVAGGLVEEDDSDPRRYRTRTGDRVSLRYRPGDTANAEAVGRVAASVLRVAGRDFARAIADEGSVVEGPRRELWVARGKAWVDRTELAEINQLLARLAELLHSPRKTRRGRLVALSWVLAPVEAKPARRRSAAAAGTRKTRTR